MSMEKTVSTSFAMSRQTFSSSSPRSKGISNSTIDMLYQKAKNVGATGGKILGAGGGGFMLLYVPEAEKEPFLKSFSGFEFVDFQFENQGVTIDGKRL